MIARLPRGLLASAIADHEPEISEMQKRPAVDAVVLGEAELLDEIGDLGVEIVHRQYVLRSSYLEYHGSPLDVAPPTDDSNVWSGECRGSVHRSRILSRFQELLKSPFGYSLGEPAATHARGARRNSFRVGRVVAYCSCR